MNTIRLNSNHHRNFIAEGRKDPITHEPLKVGDEIVICSRDKIAFLADNWNGACPLCGNRGTLSDLPQAKKMKLIPIKKHHWVWYVMVFVIFILFLLISIS